MGLLFTGPTCWPEHLTSRTATLTEARFRASEADLRAFILGHKETKPHLQYMAARGAGRVIYER